MSFCQGCWYSSYTDPDPICFEPGFWGFKILELDPQDFKILELDPQAFKILELDPQAFKILELDPQASEVMFIYYSARAAEPYSLYADPDLAFQNVLSPDSESLESSN